MNQSDTMTVTDINGQRGLIEERPDAQPGGNPVVTVRLENGQKLLVPFEVLTQRSDGTYTLPFALSEFYTKPAGMEAAAAAQSPLSTLAEHQLRYSGDNVIVPVIAEEVTVDKRVIQTGGVRIHKTVHERLQTVDISLIEDHVEVERVPVNRVLEGQAEVRREGDTLIVPLLEEVLVVEKRLMLKEELHIRMRREEVNKPQEVLLRREEVNIERFTADAAEAQAVSETMTPFSIGATDEAAVLTQS